MNNDQNSLGQPIGFPLSNWRERPYPSRSSIVGRYCRTEPLEPERHARDLYHAYAEDKNHGGWTYLPYGPFAKFTDFLAWLEPMSAQDDPLFYAILDKKTEKAVGLASYLRIQPKVGVLEVGHIHYSPLLQKTPLATEAMFLLMRRAFDELGYRRYEWKCDALNAGSRKAALRLGFTFEGIFRQASVYKGRSRDTVWYSVIDKEWPALKEAHEAWLSSENFDAQGRQLARLSTLISEARVKLA